MNESAPAKRKRSAGASLLRLGGLVVVAYLAFPLIVDLLAPAHSHLTPIRAAMKQDLRNLVTAQESYFADNNRFATSLSLLEFSSTTSVAISLAHADSLSWSAEASWTNLEGRCRISVGKWAGAPADSLEGQPVCDPQLEGR